MLELKNIYKDYFVDKKPLHVLKDINLAFSSKEFCAILGPSGCGKTTLLNLIGGLDHYTSGDLIINDKSTKQFIDKDWDAFRNSKVGFVFQTYNLVPHLSVLANVELSLTLTGISKKEREERAKEVLLKVGLEKEIKKRPNQLSGGQMQRVAIARALINNPEIILADEPTGALDSVTSIQVMDILKEISKDKLVIMVTHNRELADKYATRIISLKDGVVTSDSAPIKVSEENKELQEDTNKKTHMSFFSALKISFQNLLTKKGRTILTSIAASFGIIGVALVLAMSNGFENYVKNVEIATASSVPITVSPYYYSYSSASTSSSWESFPKDKEIFVYDDSVSSTVTHRNKISAEYSAYCKELTTGRNPLASSVLENHDGLDFNVFTTRGEEVIKIDQYNSAGSMGGLLSSVTGLPTTIFHELYGDQQYIMSMYDLIEGSYPTSTNQVVLIADRYNRIPVNTLYQLGIVESDVVTAGESVSFDDIIGKTYKCYTPEKIYNESTKITEEVNSWNIDMKTLMPDETTPIVKKTITAYDDITRDANKLKEFYENDAQNSPISLQITGIIRPSEESQVTLMPGSIGFLTSLKDYYISLKDNSSSKIGEAAISNWVLNVTSSYPTEWIDLISTLLSGDTTYLTNKINAAFSFYSVNKTAGGEMNKTSIKYAGYESQCKVYGCEFVAPEYVATLSSFQITNYEDLVNGPLDFLTYVSGYSTISTILIFPSSLADKEKIFTYLDKWNEGKETADTILYSDIAGTLTSSIGTMVQVVSTVLIAFSSISLVVSCVMTGIITYVSVIERTKEIGILRAIGARKKDVGRLFEAESVIIGFAAGAFGVLVALILQLPINLIINGLYPNQGLGSIANLSWISAVVLIAISMLLTFISGFIPARLAAKKDPVVALRTE